MCVINVDQGLVPTTPAATVRPTVTVTAQESTTPSTVATSTGPTTTRLATSYIYISSYNYGSSSSHTNQALPSPPSIICRCLCHTSINKYSSNNFFWN